MKNWIFIILFFILLLYLKYFIIMAKRVFSIAKSLTVVDDQALRRLQTGLEWHLSWFLTTGAQTRAVRGVSMGRPLPPAQQCPRLLS